MPEVGQSACNRYTDELCGIFNYMPIPENFRNGFRTSRPQISLFRRTREPTVFFTVCKDNKIPTNIH